MNMQKYIITVTTGKCTKTTGSYSGKVRELLDIVTSWDTGPHSAIGMAPDS